MSIEWNYVRQAKAIGHSWQRIADKLGVKKEALRSGYRVRFGDRKAKRPETSPADAVAQDVQAAQSKRDEKAAKAKYDAAVDRIQELEQRVEVFEQAAATPVEVTRIERSLKGGKSEAVLVVNLSDWHIEERVRLEEVNGKNEYTLAIAEKRKDDCFKGIVRLAEILNRDVHIDTMVLALLGDFITGDIHDENLETAQLEPMVAMLLARDWLASGIEFILEHTTYNLTIPCHSGNHARTTRDYRYATEAGHSLEYAMYHSLAKHFANEPRVKFIIPRGYHSYVQAFDTTLRFHHGHAIRYAGGVGGPTIPINKAIANWNTVRWADIDCFGHLHQRLDGENFVMNGSLIGYNAYAMAIRAKYQRPSQTMFLIDAKRGKTAVWPIVFTV